MSPSAILELDAVDARYGDTIVLRNVSLRVEAGSVVAILGANGAGKTTMMRVAAGLLRPSSGRVVLGGSDVTGQRAHRLAAAGLCLVPEGRGVFRSLTVRENLQLFGQNSDGLDALFARFPVLGQRLRQLAGTLSGGEQQQLALGRAYLTRPKVALLDEVSMGLAPLLIERIFESIADLKALGTSVLLVEQYVQRALAVADYVYVLARGSVAFSGTPESLDRDSLLHSYMHHEIETVDVGAAAKG